MLVVSIMLISVTKLDVVVTGAGRTVASEGTLYIQPFDKGIIREIKVRAGDLVKKGQLLATLDPTYAAADLSTLEETVASTQADMDRLEAEKSGQPYHPDRTGRYALLEESLYDQRQSLYRSSTADFDEKIATTQATIESFKHDVEEYSHRLKVNTDVEEMRLKLQQEGWGSKLEALGATDARMEVQRLMNYSASQITENEHTLDSLKAQRTAFVDQWNSQISQWLANDRSLIAKAQGDLSKAKMAHQLVNIVSPADAYVLKIGKASTGTVVDPNTMSSDTDPLFTLVPEATPLVVEMIVDSKDTGFIHVGDPVEIKLDAYQFIRYGTAKGVLKSISSDSFTTDWNGQPTSPYFKAHVAITSLDLHDVPSTFALIPGMTLTADVMAGRRTILSYVVDGALRRASEAMREP
jgi:HlyD family type I secretion membrane fusion protein